MKDQYVADVNDFLKYALLRSLASAGVSVYAAWMLTPSDGRQDGGRLAYLARPESYRQVDPVLFDELRSLVEEGRRSVAEVEDRGFLPLVGSTRRIVGDDSTGRRAFFEEALNGARSADVVFFDPDNGLEVTSVRAGSRNSSKYLLWEEFARAYASGHSVVVYQHFPRRPRAAFIAELAARIHITTTRPRIHAISTSHVAFLVVSRPEHAAAIDEAVASLGERAVTHLSVATLEP